MSDDKNEIKPSTETEEELLKTETLDPKFKLEIAKIPGRNTPLLFSMRKMHGFVSHETF